MTGISDSTTIEDLAALVSEALTAGITAVLSGAARFRGYERPVRLPDLIVSSAAWRISRQPWGRLITHQWPAPAREMSIQLESPGR